MSIDIGDRATFSQNSSLLYFVSICSLFKLLRRIEQQAGFVDTPPGREWAQYTFLGLTDVFSFVKPKG